MIIAAPVGPVGVLCVRRTIFEGPVYGFVSGLGAAVADALFGIVAAFGLTVISDFLIGHQGWLKGVGAAFLLFIGGRALLWERDSAPAPISGDSLLGAFASTFALTVTNPITILAFAGVFAAAGLSGEEATWGRAGMLVAGVFAGSLAWWFLLCAVAGGVRHLVREVHLVWVSRSSGAILVAFAFFLILTMTPWSPID
ncbi:lysine transporter LysE [Allostella humosa]|uniref:LysE family translocator n=1 Tax=Stella humosa TaxID=94 RepID=UPI001136C324|nr:LysE family transporter [Stella humosa]BBK33901.1 lysine transporter LysE [Stella humosa]